MATNPYGASYRQRRKRLLARNPTCWVAGCDAIATTADHDPPLSAHNHAEGTRCCRLRPMCAHHQAKQGGEIAAAKARAKVQAGIESAGDREFAEPATISPGDDCWDAAPWLDEFRAVPEQATWPRFMTASHPAATGTFGPQAEKTLRESRGLELRWFQRLAMHRMLEHDANGDLVWINVLLTTARRVGKSYLSSAWCVDRLLAAERHGQKQFVMHTGKDLPVCKEVQRDARAWARRAGLYVRDQNGNEEIATVFPRDPNADQASRWVVRSLKSVYGYGATGAFVDEAWGIDPAVIEDGIEGTLIDSVSPQMVLTSTAHSRSKSLMVTRRIKALSELRDPGHVLLLEWSAPRGVDMGDRDAWRQASPEWSPTREKLIAARYANALAGEAFDRDEDDPEASFRSQYLNVWPLVSVADSGMSLIDDQVWRRCDGARSGTPQVLHVAVADNHGNGAAVAAVARYTDGLFEVDGWECASRRAAFESADALAASFRGAAKVVRHVHATLGGGRPVRESRFGPTDISRGLSSLRDSVDLVVHDNTTELDGQMSALRVKESVTGQLAIVSVSRCDIVWALAGAFGAACVEHAKPAIR